MYLLLLLSMVWYTCYLFILFYWGLANNLGIKLGTLNISYLSDLELNWNVKCQAWRALDHEQAELHMDLQW